MHAVEQSPSTIIVTDSEGKIVFANPKFSKTTGYFAEEAIGSTPRLLKSGETSTEEYQRLWKTIKAGKEWRGIFHNKRKDGTLYWERASISPVHDGKGKITHFMAIKEDITEFIEADVERRHVADMYGAVFSALPVAIVLVDKQGRLLMANRAAEILFGAEMPRGTMFKELNLLWLDEQEVALPITEHPLTYVIEGKIKTKYEERRIGVVPPTGGVRWLRVGAQSVEIPDTQELVALLVLSEETTCQIREKSALA
jgi:PAS domain S-box-containing protein